MSRGYFFSGHSVVVVVVSSAVAVTTTVTTTFTTTKLTAIILPMSTEQCCNFHSREASSVIIGLINFILQEIWANAYETRESL